MPGIVRTLTRVCVAAAGPLAACACTTQRENAIMPTATEQLLVSTAADRALDRIALPLPKGDRIFVDPSDLDIPAAKYVVGGIKDHLLRQGMRLVDDRKLADTVVEIRAGALSLDDSSTLVGTPAFDVPIPLTGPFNFPELALYKEKERLGVAKLAVTAYGAKDGGLQGSSGPTYGFSHQREWTVLLFLTWARDDTIPKGERQPTIDIQPPELPTF